MVEFAVYEDRRESEYRVTKRMIHAKWMNTLF